MELDEQKFLEAMKNEVGIKTLDDFISGRSKETTIDSISKAKDAGKISELLLKFAKKMYWKGYKTGFKDSKEFNK